MERGADRRRARACVALAAVVFAIGVASSPVANRVGRDQRLQTLVRLASASERLDARITYQLERIVPSGESLVVGFESWQRHVPRLTVRADAVSMVVDNQQMHLECREQPDGVVCSSSASRLATTDASRLYFVAVRVTKAYRVVERPNRRIAGENAECLQLVAEDGETRVAALGERLELCFAADGALLMSDRISTDSHDRQVADRVQRGFDITAYKRLLEKFRPTVATGQPT